ncbi:MAG: hypothetical protein UZ12_BCD005000757 [Bacteroidetes bacterium OLB12]|nr:MAG: hypothetical protein UZ12_BCD005000757 [Bacteroidetes bacterium OLB12]
MPFRYLPGTPDPDAGYEWVKCDMRSLLVWHTDLNQYLSAKGKFDSGKSDAPNYWLLRNPE